MSREAKIKSVQSVSERKWLEQTSGSQERPVTCVRGVGGGVGVGEEVTSFSGLS